MLRGKIVKKAHLSAVDLPGNRDNLLLNLGLLLDRLLDLLLVTLSLGLGLDFNLEKWGLDLNLGLGLALGLWSQWLVLGGSLGLGLGGLLNLDLDLLLDFGGLNTEWDVVGGLDFWCIVVVVVLEGERVGFLADVVLELTTVDELEVDLVTGGNAAWGIGAIGKGDFLVGAVDQGGLD